MPKKKMTEEERKEAHAEASRRYRAKKLNSPTYRRKVKEHCKKYRKKQKGIPLSPDRLRKRRLRIKANVARYRARKAAEAAGLPPPPPAPPLPPASPLQRGRTRSQTRALSAPPPAPAPAPEPPAPPAPSAPQASPLQRGRTRSQTRAAHDSLEAAPDPHQRLCMQSSECEIAAGEVCWWYYSGCRVGQCMCDPRWSFRDPGKGCRTMKLGNEPCKPNDKCPDGMACLGGRCLCITGSLTPDHTFCLKRNERLLGQICNDMTDICYQKSTHGYSMTKVLCNVMGFCSCREGYKEEGSSCVRWNIGERGCLKNYHCQGGALCIDGYCKCPTGYEPGAGKSMCVRQGATFDLRIGQQCDEINENRYCAKDYVCHRCAGQHNYTCVKFLETQHRQYVSSATHLSPNLVLSIISIASYILAYVSIANWKNR